MDKSYHEPVDHTAQWLEALKAIGTQPGVTVHLPEVNVEAPIVPAADLSAIQAAILDLKEQMRAPRHQTVIRDQNGRIIGVEAR